MQALTPGTNYPSSTLSELDFCFLSILMENDRTDNFTFDYEQNRSLFVHNQEDIVSATTFFSVWKETENLALWVYIGQKFCVP